jgi:hypothetical protein
MINRIPFFSAISAAYLSDAVPKANNPGGATYSGRWFAADAAPPELGNSCWFGFWRQTIKACVGRQKWMFSLRF